MRKIICLIAATLLVAVAPAKENTIRKTVFIIVDGVPADIVEKVNTPAIDSIAAQGGYHRSFTGGHVGTTTETPTISAVCYNNILTATWVDKHNVHGNDIKNPNYNYPTIFKVAKDYMEGARIGVFSGWEENRTLLVGDGAVGTGKLRVDYFFKGSDRDTKKYPTADSMRIFNLDQDVAECAAKCIVENGPDISWVYLWYMDESGHKYGTGERFCKDLEMVDKQVSLIWNSVKARAAATGEEWLTIVTTDHGRTPGDGYSHGGQTERERCTWIAMDQPGNAHFKEEQPVSCTDILPTICNFMNIRVPVKIAREWEGVPMIGKVDFSDFKAVKEGEKIHFTWKGLSKNDVIIRITTTNNIKTGEVSGRDKWLVIGRRNAMDGDYEWECKNLPSDSYRFYMESKNTVEGASLSQ